MIIDNYSHTFLLKKVRFSFKQLYRCKTKWRILFFGADQFSVESLQQIHHQLFKDSVSRLEVITTQSSVRKNEIYRFSQEKNIKVHSWPIASTISEFDIGVVVSFGHLIPTWIIQSFPLGMINVHASLLPRWRGAAPIIHSILHGDTTTGISIIKVMPKKFDIGNILLQSSIDIRPDETQPELHHRLAVLGGNLLVEIIRKLPSVLNSGKLQSEEDVTYAPKISKEIKNIQWSKMTAANVYNLYRALVGIYQLTTHFNNQTIKLTKIELATDFSDSSKILPGRVLYSKKFKSLFVQCQDGLFVSVKHIIMPRRSAMTASDFYNGFMHNSMKEQVIFSDKNITD